MKNNISHMLEKAGLCGVSALLVGSCFLGFGKTKWEMPYTGLQIPVEFFTFGIGTANSFATDAISLFFHEAVPLGKKSSDRIYHINMV